VNQEAAEKAHPSDDEDEDEPATSRSGSATAVARRSSRK
jgi:hypothetical protein